MTAPSLAGPLSSAEPALVLAAHGTRSRAGERTLEHLAHVMRARRPGHRVTLAYLEISRPSLGSVLATLTGPAVVVPLLLAGGYHVHVDLPETLTRRPTSGHVPDVLPARHLGPHPLLAHALARRLDEAGLTPRHRVVLGAAGSSDPAARAEVRAAARLLAVRLARPVTAAYAGDADFTAEGTPPLAAAIGPDTAIASYLLAPGFFHDRLRAAGAPLVSAPLGEEVAELGWLRYDEAVQRARKCQPIQHHARTTATRPAG
ncbi:sirohydrochlorin chelatase [Nonomuraea sp. NPDC050328]|uniref:sirohydrochlorin chelatase n=1 Tax=Nonomuraea sp. NPDC050328 TaxID=3364361 RepID=UPI0037BDA046